LQEDYDLEEALRANHVEIDAIQPLVAAPYAA